VRRCIFDLTTSHYAGWAFDGKCFTPFDDHSSGWCKECVSFSFLLSLTVERRA